MSRSNPTPDFVDFDIQQHRPSWIDVQRANGIMNGRVVEFLKKDPNFNKIASSLTPQGNPFKSLQDIFLKNTETLNAPTLTNRQQQYALAMRKFLEILSLKAKALSKKELKKELKELKELFALKAKQHSEKERIDALNRWLEAERQKALQQVKTVENTPKPKESPKMPEKIRLSKKQLGELLGKLGLPLTANSKDIHQAYENILEDKQRNPGKYSEQESAEIEQAYEMLSGLDDHELEIIAQSNDQLTSTEATQFLETLNLNPNEQHTVEEIEQAFYIFSLNNALKTGEPDSHMQGLFQAFVNQTDGMKPNQLVDLQPLMSKLSQQQSPSPRPSPRQF